MATSVTNHVKILANTVNVTEMGNAHRAALPTATVQDVSSCARKTAMRP